MIAFRVLGFVFLGAAIAGVFLPLLPTTPFVLLATGCFARSSEKWHRWMLNNPTFGPMVRNWERDRCVTCRVKLIAITSMVLVGGYSIAFAVESVMVRAIGAALLLTGLVVVSMLATCKRKPEQE